MTNIILVAILVVNIALIALLVLVFARVQQVYRDFEAFIVPAEDGQPSPLAQAVNAVTDHAVASLLASVKGQLMGVASGLVRADKALEGDIAEGIADQSPMMSGLMDAFPALRKTLKRNPQLAALALSKLGGIGNVSSASGGATPQSGSPANFKLGIGGGK